MKTNIIAIALFTLTVGVIAFYPAYRPVGAVTHKPIVTPPVGALSSRPPRIDVVFALDTTGSMGGLIDAAKEKIWSIAGTMASAQPAPEIRMGLIAYRDRGDAYVTRVLDLSQDLDSMYAALMDFKAAGGGDGPESVNEALHDAVNRISWSAEQNAYKVIFLVGDAPPHMDYANEVKYPETLALAKTRGIVVNAIQCGSDQSTTLGWQQIAQLGSGSYFQVGQDGSAVAIATPFDEELAMLSRKLDGTRLYYGSTEEKAKKRRKMAATEKLHSSASVESRARRAAFNASPSGKDNLLGEGELVDDISSGRVSLGEIDEEALPEPMQAMPLEEQQVLIAESAERRDQLQRQIKELSKKRVGYMKQKLEESGGAASSLDEKIYSAVREQAGKKGLKYDADSAVY